MIRYLLFKPVLDNQCSVSRCSEGDKARLGEGRLKGKICGLTAAAAAACGPALRGGARMNAEPVCLHDGTTPVTALSPGQ